MSNETPAATFHETYDKPFTDAAASVESALSVLEQAIPQSPALIAGKAGLAAMKAEYLSKVVLDLRPQRDAYQKTTAEQERRLGELEQRAGLKK